MRNLNVAATVIFFLLFSSVCRSQDGKFTFKIAASANTSAGVFQDDSILVRTLWNNVYYNAGTYTSTWDGKDDNGVTVTTAASNFEVKIVTSNVKYQWQGVIGNSSRVQTGSGVHRGYYHCMRGLVFTNGYGYYCRGYAEGAPSIAKFNIADPQYKIDFAKTNQPGDISYVATDDITIYWAVHDANANNNTFVFGSKVSDDSDVPFSEGSSYSVTFGKTYSNAISVLNQPNSGITGLAVQKQGKYLFVSRAGIDELQILNNPALSTLNITYQAGKESNNTIRVYSISGVKMYEQKINAAKGLNKLSIPVQSLQRGIYVVVIDSVQSKKFIKG